MCSDLEGKLHLSHLNPFRNGEVLIKLLHLFYIYMSKVRNQNRLSKEKIFNTRVYYI